MSINSWDPDRYNRHARFVSDLAKDVVELLNPKKGERILDIGCGDGVLSLILKERSQELIAIDSSKEMIKKAKSNSINAFEMSILDMPFKDEFDAVFSNAMLHWVSDAQEAIKAIHNSLRDGGRFVAEFGGYGNISTILDVIYNVFDNHREFGEFINPWYFPTTKEYKRLLENQGFNVEYIELIPRDTEVDEIANWLNIFANGIISHLNQNEQNLFLKETEEALKKTKLYTKDKRWIVDYVRIRIKATI